MLSRCRCGRLCRWLLGHRELGFAIVFREFDRGGNRYVVLKKLRGRPLLKDDKALPGGTSSRRAERMLVQLKPILAKLHGAGWVWRDCKPSHILLDRGEIRLVDFEGACRVGKTDVLPSGSPGYTRRPRLNYCRRPGISEDQYALGAIAFQIATGKLPPRVSRPDTRRGGPKISLR